MRTLITQHQKLTRHIIANRDMYPHLQSYKRIITIGQHARELMIRSDTPHLILNQTEQLAIWLQATDNINTAEHIQTIYDQCRQYGLDVTDWKDAPEQELQKYHAYISQYTDIHNENKTVDGFMLNHTMQHMDIPATLYKTQVIRPYQSYIDKITKLNPITISPHCIQLLVNETQNPQAILETAEELYKSHQSIILTSSNDTLLNNLTQALPSNSSHISSHCSTSLDQTTWYQLWHTLLSIPKRFVPTNTLLNLAQQPYTQKILAREQRHILSSALAHWPAEIVDTDLSYPILDPLLAFIKKQQTLRSQKHMSNADWIEVFHKTTQIWKLSTPSSNNPYHCESMKKWSYFLMVIRQFNRKMQWSDWLKVSHIIAKRIAIEPSADETCPIQIVPLANCSGIASKSIILLDFHDHQWPKKSSIPGWPSTTSNKLNELKTIYGKQLLNDIVSQIPHVYCLSFQDNHHKKCAAFSSDITKQLVLPPPKHGVASPLNLYESLPWKEPTLKSAVQLLSHYAHCPTRGYIFHRLQIKRPQIPNLGTDARARGIIIHEWLSQRSSITNFSSWFQGIIQRFIKEGYYIPKNLWHHEMSRCQKMIHSYLELEQQWPSLAKMTEMEKSYEYAIDGVHCKLRVDGVLNFGSHAILIDYKTSAHSISDCLPHRLTAPQLPLYSLAFMGKQVIGASYLIIQEHTSFFSGLTWSRETPYPLKHYSNNILKEWQDELLILMQKIKSGNSAPQPINEALCNECAVRSICRHTLHQDQSYATH